MVIVHVLSKAFHGVFGFERTGIECKNPFFLTSSLTVCFIVSSGSQSTGRSGIPPEIHMHPSRVLEAPFAIHLR